MITQYLLEAYRRLEMAANREHMTDEQALAFESAIADIQLLGSPDQISTTFQYLDAYASTGGSANKVLCLLRDDLRKELGLSLVEKPPKMFRFTRGNPVSRTTIARTEKDTKY